ncbi:MAG: hypothetical protein PHU68_04165 [Paludibacter sp.]|nr:hypothetical protein [Paludibacter sp.]
MIILFLILFLMLVVEMIFNDRVALSCRVNPELKVDSLWLVGSIALHNFLFPSAVTPFLLPAFQQDLSPIFRFYSSACRPTCFWSAFFALYPLIYTSRCPKLRA